MNSVTKKKYDYNHVTYYILYYIRLTFCIEEYKSDFPSEDQWSSSVGLAVYKFVQVQISQYIDFLPKSVGF